VPPAPVPANHSEQPQREAPLPMSILRPVTCLIVLLACACVQQPPADPDAGPAQGGRDQPGAEQGGPPPQGAPGEGGEQGAPGEPAVTDYAKPSEMAVGEWALELTPSQQRQLELLELAFRDPPPTEAELSAFELQPDEQLMIGMVLMGREQHPDELTTPELQRSLDELSSATLTITADSLVFTHGEERDEARYTVLSEETTSMQLETTTTVDGQPVVEKVNVQFESEHRLQLWAEGEGEDARQRFARRGVDLEAAPTDPQPQPPPQGEPPPAPE
jgi:hypothetical protein